VFWNTLRISVITSLLATVLAYPVAFGDGQEPADDYADHHADCDRAVDRQRGRARIRLAVDSDQRPKGMLNWILMTLHIVDAPVAILYTEKAVIIGSLHVFFPMMVLPLASALGKIDPIWKTRPACSARHGGRCSFG